jgi:hypothetical protein
MNGSRFFVLKTKWIRIDDRDWGTGVPSFQIYFALSALPMLTEPATLGRLAQAFTFRAFGA